MDNSIQKQIDELNTKMDVLLDYVNEQRQNSGVVEDLISDVSIVGKEVYDSTVEALDHSGIELDTAELQQLMLGLVRNLKNFNDAIALFESANDFVQDIVPIGNELIIDLTKRLGEFEEKGYFEFFGEAGKIIDNIVTHFSKEDVQSLADNVVIILEMVKGITQPEMLKSLDNALKVYSSLDMDEVPEYSIWRMMREMNTPETKRAMGFMMTFLKNLSAK